MSACLDLICHKDSNFLGNYIGLAITIATWQFWDVMSCRLLRLRDTVHILPAQVCLVLWWSFFLCLNRELLTPPISQWFPKFWNLWARKNVRHKVINSILLRNSLQKTKQTLPPTVYHHFVKGRAFSRIWKEGMKEKHLNRAHLPLRKMHQLWGQCIWGKHLCSARTFGWGACRTKVQPSRCLPSCVPCMDCVHTDEGMFFFFLFYSHS